ncbi:hypothetical protein BT10792_24115 [Bacillus thuringiensis]|nr:hypothetical protein BT10792_24115 [Bacillus thuringiensis]
MLLILRGITLLSALLLILRGILLLSALLLILRGIFLLVIFTLIMFHTSSLFFVITLLIVRMLLPVICFVCFWCI